MITSQIMSLSSATSLNDEVIPPFEVGYLKAAARDEAYELVLGLFLQENEEHGHVTKAFVGRRSGKSPEQITRLLASPSNMTIDTLALLCAALGHKPVFAAEKISNIQQGNFHHVILAKDAQQPVQNRPSAIDYATTSENALAPFEITQSADGVEQIVRRKPLPPSIHSADISRSLGVSNPSWTNTLEPAIGL